MGGGKGLIILRVRAGLSKEAAFKLNPKNPTRVGQTESEVGHLDRGNSVDQASEEIKHMHLKEQTGQSGRHTVPEGWQEWRLKRQ